MTTKVFDFWTAALRTAPRKHSPVGSKIRPEFKLVLEPDGNRRLEQTGVRDQYEITQSYKQACSIESILKRAEYDPTVLQQRQGVYCDTTLLPQDLISATAAVRRAEELYSSLPADVRSRYGSFNSFIEQFGSLEGIQGFINTMNDSAFDGNEQSSEVDPKQEVFANDQ